MQIRDYMKLKRMERIGLPKIFKIFAHRGKFCEDAMQEELCVCYLLS